MVTLPGPYMIRRSRSTVLPALLLGLAAAAPAVAPAPLTAQQREGFLFGPPKVTLAVRGGYAVPSAGSEIFDFVQEQLTLEKGDFNAIALMGEVGIALNDRLDLALGVGFTRSRKRSEFRDWIGDDDLPIEQTTELSRVPVTATLKYFLMDRGRSVSRLAWVPARWSPFVGIGGGIVSYDFEQRGEFVDFETFDIFRDILISGGQTGIAHVVGGADVALTPNILLTGEGRYAWASAEMSSDFSGFDALDLSGFQATVGFAVRF